VISPETASTMGSGPDMAAMLHGLFWLVSNAATATPLLLSVDDAHWSDPSSLRALAYLADRLPDLPVLLAVSFRPDEPGAAEPLLDALTAGMTSSMLPRP